MTTKVTKRDYFEQIITLAEAADRNDIVTFAQKEIEALERKKVKARENAAKKRASEDGLTDAVLAAVTDEPMTIADIAANVQYDGEFSVSKVSYRLNKLWDKGNGVLEKGEIVIKNEEGGKSRKVVAYKLA